jgi:hypothetical protein
VQQQRPVLAEPVEQPFPVEVGRPAADQVDDVGAVVPLRAP